MDIEGKLSIFIIVWCFGTLLCDFDEDLYFWVGSSFRSLALVFLLANLFLNWALRVRSPTNRRSSIDSAMDVKKRRASNRIWPTSSIGSISTGFGRLSVGAGSRQRSMQPEISSNILSPRGLLSAGGHLSAAGSSISCCSDGRFRQTSDEKHKLTLSPRRYSTGNSRLRRKSGENPVVQGKMGPLLQVGAPQLPQQLSNGSFNLSRLGSQLSGYAESEEETWQGGAADQDDIPTWLLLNLEARGLLNQTAKSVIDRRNYEDRQEDEQVEKKPPLKRSSSLPLAFSIIRRVSALFSRKTSDPKYEASDDQNLRQRPSREIRQSIPDLITASEELPSSTDFRSCSFNIDKRVLERQLRGASSDQIGDENKSIASQAPYQRCRCVGQFHTCMTPASSILCSDWCSLEGSTSSSDMIRKPLDTLAAHTSIRLLATEQFSATEDNELFVSVLNTQDVPPDALANRIDTIDPQKLATAILLDDASDLLVVDVRGKDHSGGHIPRSIHMRTADVIRNAGVLMNKIQQYNVSTVVFTCMYSVLRARKCASALIDYGQKENKMPVKICVLAGGFHRWLNTYRKDPQMFAALVENFNEDFWTMRLDDSGLVHIMDAVWSDAGQNLLQRHLEELGRPPPMTEQQDTAHSLPLGDKKKASVSRLRNSISDLNQINSSSSHDNDLG